MLQTLLALAAVTIAPAEQIDVIEKRVVSFENKTLMGVERMMPVMVWERHETVAGAALYESGSRQIYSREDSAMIIAGNEEKLIYVTIDRDGRSDVKEMSLEEFGLGLAQALTGEKYEGSIEDFSYEDFGIDKRLKENEFRKTGRVRVIAGIECEEYFRSVTFLQEDQTHEDFIWYPIDEELKNAYDELEIVSYLINGDERVLRSYERTIEVNKLTETMPENWPLIYDDKHAKTLGSK